MRLKSPEAQIDSLLGCQSRSSSRRAQTAPHLSIPELELLPDNLKGHLEYRHSGSPSTPPHESLMARSTIPLRSSITATNVEFLDEIMRS